MAARARALTETEAEDWARFARRIAPLPGTSAVVWSDDGPPSQAVRTPVAPVVSIPAVRPGPLGIGGQPASVDSATWQRFHRGQLGITRKLDLHGMTAQHAFHA